MQFGTQNRVAVSRFCLGRKALDVNLWLIFPFFAATGTAARFSGITRFSALPCRFDLFFRQQGERQNGCSRQAESILPIALMVDVDMTSRLIPICKNSYAKP